MSKKGQLLTKKLKIAEIYKKYNNEKESEPQKHFRFLIEIQRDQEIQRNLAIKIRDN